MWAVFDSLRSTVRTLNIGTPRPATVVVLNIKQFNFTMKYSLSPDPFFASLFSFLFVRDTNLAHPIKNCSLHSLV